MGFLTRDKQFYRSFFSMVFFIAVQNVITFGVNLADNVMLGQYSETALSGAALSNQVQFLLQMVVGGAGEGMMVLTAQYWGKGDAMPIRRIVAKGMAFGVPVVAGFFAVSFFFPQAVLSLLSNEAPILSAGAQYLGILSFSFPFFYISSLLTASQRSVGNSKLGMFLSLAALFLNVGLNYVLIFGHLGFPAMGIRGAAYATLTARVVECLLAAGYVLCLDKRLQMKIKDFFTFDRLLNRDFNRIALPVVLSGSSWGIAMGVQTSILGHMGPAAIGANSIATALYQVVTVVAFGAAAAASILMGQTVGRGDLHLVKAYSRTLQTLFLLIGLVTGGLLYLMRGPVISLYGADIAPETQALADSFLTILSITVVGTAYQMACLTGIVRGGGNTRFVLINDLVFMWGLVLPAAYLCAFVFRLSPAVVFFCLKSDQITKCLVAVFVVNRYRWVRQVTRTSSTV